MVDNYRAERQFERFLYLTPHEPVEEKDELIATIIYHRDTGKVEVKRVDGYKGIM